MSTQDADEHKSFLRQLTMVSIVSLGTIIAGAMNGWSAPALVKLQSGEDIFNITSAEGSALTLYAEIGHFVIPIPSGIVADYFGRKPMFIIASGLSLISWGILTFGNALIHYIIARTILGFGFGIHCMLMTIYIAEISSVNVRGMFGSTSMFSLNVGVLFQFVIGGLLTLRESAAITFALIIIQFILVFFIVESPYFLAASQQYESAEINLFWLRAAEPDNDSVADEFASIKKRVQVRQNPLTSVKNVFSKNNYKGFVLCMIISFLGELTGRVTILTYASESFKTADALWANTMTILLGVCNVLFPIIPILFSDKAGRKSIILVSAIVAFFMHLASGLIFFLHLNMNVDLPMFQWIIFVSIASYQSCCSVYTTNILTLRGELISENSRGFASGFSSMAFAFAVVIATKSFQTVRDLYGVYYAFWMLSSFAVLLIAFTWVFIPETKNRTFEDIQLELSGADVQKTVDNVEAESK